MCQAFCNNVPQRLEPEPIQINEGICRKYVRIIYVKNMNMKDYEGICEEYEGISGKYEGICRKYEGICQYIGFGTPISI